MTKTEIIREKYSPENYEALDIGDYRRRFPDETEGFSDEQLFDIVMGVDDDLDDADWRVFFEESKK